MQTNPTLRDVRWHLRAALWLAGFIVFGNVVAIAATLGAFNGGQPTSTPPLAEVYFVVSIIATIGLAYRTQQAIQAADRGDVAALRRIVNRPLVFVGWFLCAFLPGIMLDAAWGRIQAL